MLEHADYVSVPQLSLRFERKVRALHHACCLDGVDAL